MIADLLSWLTDGANWVGDEGLLQRIAEHLFYTVLSVALAAVIALPLGLWIGHTGRGGNLVVGFANAMRALPTLGVVTLLALLFGVLQTAPVLAGLVLLAIPPILAGAYSGVQSVDRGVTDAASGVGMTPLQKLLSVEIPTAAPLIIGGLRSAFLQVIATAAVAAYVGLGGLGRPMLDGLRDTDYPMVASAALVIAALAVVVDLIMSAAQRILVPRGVRLASNTGG